MTTCSELLIQLLENYGIDTVFGIPGVHTVELYRHFPGSGLNHVTPRHEQGAGFMADGYARASGRPAACFVISGPGVTNIITAMGQAYADSIPMLVISSVNNLNELGLGEGRLHELPEQRNTVAGVCEFSHTLTSAKELPGVMARAFAVFNGARPRPVHIEIPLNVMAESVGKLTATANKITARPGPDPVLTEAAAKLLKDAKRPMVVLGGGVQDAALAARELVDKLAAPVVTTINAKGILPENHPLSLGTRISMPAVLNELRCADVVLAIGTELGETDTLLFNERLTLEGRLIRIDIDAQQLARNVLADISILSDSKLACHALLENLGEFDGPFELSSNRTRKLVDLSDAEFTQAQQMHKKIMQVVQQALPGVIVVGDSTQLIYSANLHYQCQQPRSYFNSTTGYGTLGYALPAAFGAKLAVPDRPVVAIIGDGGLQFTISELACGVEFNLAVAILLWNNNGYAEIKKYMIENSIAPLGVDIYTPDFQTIGRGFGCDVARVENLAQLKQQLQNSQRKSLPSIIEIDEKIANLWE